MIKLNSITIENNNGISKLLFNSTVAGKEEQFWFEVEEKYEKYLCNERIDAFVIGFLKYAMINNYDIVSDIPITEELLYNLTEHLIPTLANNDDRLYNIKIVAPTISEPIECANAVGTGMSCGVDSFHVLAKMWKSDFKSLNLTHLTVFNVGSFKTYSKFSKHDLAKDKIYEDARKIADEAGLEFVETNSNIGEFFDMQHLFKHTFSSMFNVFCLQKLFKTYYYASTYDYKHFDVVNTFKKDTAYYDLLSLDCFATKTLRLYSEGSNVTRYYKTADIVDFELAQKYLHVCVRTANNCSECTKCRRTMLALYSMGALEKFSQVFDVEYFYNHKTQYLEWLYDMHFEDNYYNAETYEKIKQEITVLMKLRVLYRHFIVPFIKSIFSVRNEFNNDVKRKVLTVLGIKLKFKTN